MGIEILERGGGSAIDELVVSLPDTVTLSTLIAEIGRVDGVAVEDVRPVDADRRDASIAALQISVALVETSSSSRLEKFCDELLHLVDGAWVVAMRIGGDGELDSGDGELDVGRDGELADLGSLVERGTPPDRAWLGAFLIGSRHLGAEVHGESTPSDVVWVHLEPWGIAVASGRTGRPFHARERQQIALLGRVAAGLLSTDARVAPRAAG